MPVTEHREAWPYNAYTLTLPVGINARGKPVELRLAGTFPLTPEHWDRMMLILETMRPGLVVDPVDELCKFLSSVLVST